MEVKNSTVSSSLQISTGVVEKIARLAALEIEGVHNVTCSTTGVKGFLHKMPIQKPVTVELYDDVAEITISISVEYGSRIPSVSDKVQKNIKNAVQSMTSVTVSKVNVIITGVNVETAEEAQD